MADQEEIPTELKPYTWYYNSEGRVWVIIAVLTKDVLNQTVWMLEKGKENPVEHPFAKVEDLILQGKIKRYIKPKK
jgi:hypothetical protein